MERSFTSPTSSVPLVVTQGGHQKAKINKLPSIQKQLSATFELAIGLEERSEDEEAAGIVKEGAYTPKDLERDRDSDTGRSIMDDAIFVTESIEMDFSKDDAQRNPRELLQRVNNKMLLCNTTPDELDAIRFLKIIKDFKVSDFGHIFSNTGFPTKSENPEFIKVKLLFDAL